MSKVYATLAPPDLRDPNAQASTRRIPHQRNALVAKSSQLPCAHQARSKLALYSLSQQVAPGSRHGRVVCPHPPSRSGPRRC